MAADVEKLNAIVSDYDSSEAQLKSMKDELRAKVLYFLYECLWYGVTFIWFSLSMHKRT